MRKYSIGTRIICAVLVISFMSSQVCASEISTDTLAAALVSDDIVPAREARVQNEIAEVTKLGAIGDGQPLVDLLSGKLPPKISLDSQKVRDVHGKVRSAISTAIQRYNNPSEKITDVGLRDLAHQTSLNLINFNSFLTCELYPFISIREGMEKHLVGSSLDEFDRDEKVILAIDWIDWLYERYEDDPDTADLRMAQYLFRLRTPEKTVIMLDGAIDRSDHRRIYTKIQGAIFGKDEVEALKIDLRDFIDGKPAQDSRFANPSSPVYEAILGMIRSVIEDHATPGDGEEQIRKFILAKYPNERLNVGRALADIAFSNLPKAVQCFRAAYMLKEYGVYEEFIKNLNSRGAKAELYLDDKGIAKYRINFPLPCPKGLPLTLCNYLQQDRDYHEKYFSPLPIGSYGFPERPLTIDEQYALALTQHLFTHNLNNQIQVFIDLVWKTLPAPEGLITNYELMARFPEIREICELIHELVRISKEIRDKRSDSYQEIFLNPPASLKEALAYARKVRGLLVRLKTTSQSEAFKTAARNAGCEWVARKFANSSEANHFDEKGFRIDGYWHIPCYDGYIKFLEGLGIDSENIAPEAPLAGYKEQSILDFIRANFGHIIDRNESISVLDVGTGSSPAFCYKIKTLFEENGIKTKVFGIDPETENPNIMLSDLTIAKAQIDGIRLERIGLESLDMLYSEICRETKFNLIFINAPSFNPVTDDMLDNMRMSLAPGGMVVITNWEEDDSPFQREEISDLVKIIGGPGVEVYETKIAGLPASEEFSNLGVSVIAKFAAAPEDSIQLPYQVNREVDSICFAAYDILEDYYKKILAIEEELFYLLETKESFDLTEFIEFQRQHAVMTIKLQTDIKGRLSTDEQKFLTHLMHPVSTPLTHCCCSIDLVNMLFDGKGKGLPRDGIIEKLRSDIKNTKAALKEIKLGANMAKETTFENRTGYASAHRYRPYLQSSVQEENVKAINIREPKDEAERIERVSIMLRRWNHATSIINKSNFASITVAVDALKLHSDKTTFLSRACSRVMDNVRRAGKLFMDAIANGIPESKQGKLTINGCERYLHDFEEANRIINEQRGVIQRLSEEFKAKYQHEDVDKESGRFEALIKRCGNMIASLQSSLEIANAFPPNSDVSLKDMADIAREKGADVEMKCSEGLRVTGNGISLKSAISNIVANGVFAASESKKEDARVKVSVSEQDGFAEIRIVDNGPGLSEEYLARTGLRGRQHVFDINNSTKGKNGTGLGTTEAWYAVTDAGGTIEAQSKPGKGTTFIIMLPIVPGQPQQSAATVKQLAGSGKPIIYNTTLERDPVVFKRSAWGGEGISRLLGWAQERISEIWFHSTQRDGLTMLPEPHRDIALQELIEENPGAMLGSGMVKKPIFNKILGKDENQPQIVHIGFNEKIIGRKEDFIQLLIRERELITDLKTKLAGVIKSEDQFGLYRDAYGEWVRHQVGHRWGDEQNTAPLLPQFMADFDQAIFDELRTVRQEIVTYMNEVELKPGQVILAPVGYIHSIVGSHQTHPSSTNPEAKNEAWYIFSAGRDTQGRESLLYFESQQTSNTTYSPFDFPTPIEWKDGGIQMRKNIRKGLDALLEQNESAPETDEAAIRIMADRAIKFEAARPEDFIVNDKVKDITNTLRYSMAVNTRVDSLIEGAYDKVWPVGLFTLERIAMQECSASIMVNPVKDSYHELFVIKGKVKVTIEGQTTELRAGSSIFVPAAFRSSYTLQTNGNAEVLRVYPPAIQATSVTAAPEGPAVLMEPAAIDLKAQISGDLPIRAATFKATLMKMLEDHKDQLFFMGVETDIGGAQQNSHIMPMVKDVLNDLTKDIINEIKDMKDAKGKSIFPNLMVGRGSAKDLVEMVRKLANADDNERNGILKDYGLPIDEDNKLNFSLNNVFIGAKNSSVTSGAYNIIKFEEGRDGAWISAIDDSRDDDYLPVFEAVTLSMMAYAYTITKADLEPIKAFYDAISNEPKSLEELRAMIKNRIIYILPKMTKFSTEDLIDLYKLACQAYMAA